MIQRWQSILLLIAGILGAIAIFFPFYVLECIVLLPNEGGEKVVQLGLCQQSYFENNTWTTNTSKYMAMALGIISLVSFVSIFLYKNRALQMRLILLNIIALVLFAAGLAYNYYDFATETENYKVISSSIQPLGIIILIALSLLHLIARKLVKKDDELVKSMDRFR